MQDKLNSLQSERHVLSGLIKYPDLYFEINQLYTDDLFYNTVHKAIYNVIGNLINKGERRGESLDIVLIANKINDLGIKFDDNINIFDYLNTFTFVTISKNGCLETAKDLEKLRLCRDIYKTGENIIKEVKNNLNKPIEQIIDNIDKVYHETVKVSSIRDAPTLLLENTIDIIEELAKNPVKEMGLITPHKDFNLKFGGLRPGNIYAFVSRSGEGKALEENTLINTDNGFKLIKDLKIGDRVFSIDGTLTRVLGIRKFYNRDVFKIKTKDNEEIIADKNHLWLVNTNYHKTDYYEILSTETIFNLCKKDNRAVKLPNILPIKYSYKDLPISPFLLGLWLGDGSSEGNFIYAKEEDAEWYIERLKKENIILRKSGNTPLRYIIENHRKLFKENNLLHNKHIPEIYLRSSIKQRIELLKGLMDTDGYVNKNTGQCEFTSCNKILAQNFRDLLFSLGIKNSLIISDAKIYGRVVNKRHRIRFYDNNCVSLPRKTCFQRKNKKRKYQNRYFNIEKLKEKKNTVCIQIDHPSKIFLCGKTMIPTHNSTFLTDMAINVTILNPKCKALILDTEMNTVDIKFRTASAISNIPQWWLETGNWINKKEYVESWNNAKKIIKEDNPVYHLNVAGKPIQELCSLIRRWYHKHINIEKGESCVIVYDYIKITGEKDTQLKEYQLIGEKVNSLKELSLELSVPLLTACQLNRSAETGTDDSSAIALSDRLLWFATFVGIFRRKRLEEIQEHGQGFGTHALIPLKYRFQGKEAFGHHDLVRVQDNNGNPKYVRNFLNYTVENFKVTEHGDLKLILRNQELRVIQGNEPEDDRNL